MGATSATGLLAVLLEYMQVCKIRKGPFRPGGRNGAVLRAAPEEFFDLNDEESPLFLYVYEGWAATSPFGTFGLGEPWHMKDVLAWAKAQLLGAGDGDDFTSRWFSF